MRKQGFLQMSFAWLFAIIVGAFILFLAIYATTKLIESEEATQVAKTGKEIGVLLNPLETSFETGKTTTLTMPVDTRIYNKCNTNGIFGRQVIKISQKSFDKWTDTDIDGGFSNKYIFSENYVEGKKFYLFSKPFDFPFKVTDIIYISSEDKKYCFVNPPLNIEEELDSLKQANILLDNCSDDTIKVCFAYGSDCDINVNYNMRYVDKGEGNMYFEGDALMYAGIFADKEVYECQVKRLMQRVGNLATLYRDKIIFIANTGCHSNLNSDLLTLSNFANNLGNSGNLNSMSNLVEDIKDKNNAAECKLW